MPLTTEEIAARLRHARVEIGLTQAEVAAQLGVHRPTVSEIEAGRRRVSSRELFQLSRILSVPVAELLAAPGPEVREIERAVFQDGGISSTRARQGIREFFAWCTTEAELEQLLELEPEDSERPVYRLRAMRHRGDAIRQGERTAEQERARLRLGEEPIRNPVEILDRQGLRVGPIEYVGTELLDGLYFETPDLGGCVGIAVGGTHVSSARLAFTTARAYARWLFQDVSVEVLRLGAGSEDLGEVRANAFVAAFLMPERGIRNYLAAHGLLTDGRVERLSWSDLLRAMEHFGVSRIALADRLQNMGLISEDEAERLGSPDVRISEIARTLGFELRGNPEEIGRRVRVLTKLAWKRRLLSAGRASEILDFPDVQAFREQMAAAGEIREVDADARLPGAANGQGACP